MFRRPAAAVPRLRRPSEEEGSEEAYDDELTPEQLPPAEPVQKKGKWSSRIASSSQGADIGNDGQTGNSGSASSRPGAKGGKAVPTVAATVGGGSSSGLQRNVPRRSRSPVSYQEGFEDGYAKGRGKGDAAFDEGFWKGKAKGRVMDGEAVSGLMSAAQTLSVAAAALQMNMAQRRHEER